MRRLQLQLGALTLLALFTAPRMSAELVKASTRTAAPDFSLPDVKNAPVRLADFKGRILLLDFWATWCGGCKVEIPWYMEFQDKYKSTGLAAVGVSLDDGGWKNVTPYLRLHPINYPIVIGDTAITNRYRVTSLPVTVLIDRQGNVATRHVGLVDKAAFEKELAALLREK